MSRLSRVFLLCALFTGLLISPAAPQTKTGDRARSVVLKDPSPQKNLFHLKTDRSMDEIWDEFMLMKKANGGDPAAEHELGIRYLLGEGFFPDTGRAAYWIRKAAEQNVITARYNYGILLNNGMGTGWNPFEAYKNFQYAARHGLADGEYAYGLELTDNLVVPRNYSEAYRWIAMAADSGYKPAKEVLHEFKIRGINVTSRAQEQSITKSKREDDSSRSSPNGIMTSPLMHPVFLDFSADSVPAPDNKTLIQDLLAESRLQTDSVLNLSSADEADSLPGYRILQSLRDAADWGSPEALTLIGRLYDKGTGVKQDIILASVYYVRATRFDSPWAPRLLWDLTRRKEFFPLLKTHADQKEPAAFLVWAELIALGFDRQLTDRQAFDLLRDAAAMKYPEALVELGVRYYSGNGVPLDQEKATTLFKQAKGLGDREANVRLAMIGLMRSERIAAYRSLFNDLQESAEKGSVLAQTMLGYCYKNGKGVPADIAKAVFFYRRAAQRGSKIADEALRDLYDEIRPKDPEFQIQE